MKTANEAAEHAHDMGLISRDAVQEVRVEVERQTRRAAR